MKQTIVDRYRQATEPIEQEAKLYILNQAYEYGIIQLTELNEDSENWEDFVDEVAYDCQKVYNASDGGSYNVWRIRNTVDGVVLDGRDITDGCTSVIRIDLAGSRDLVYLAHHIETYLSNQ